MKTMKKSVGLLLMVAALLSQIAPALHAQANLPKDQASNTPMQNPSFVGLKSNTQLKSVTFS